MRANDHELQKNAKVIASQKIKERDYWLRKLSGDIEKSYFPYDYRIKDNRHIKTVKFSFGGELFLQLLKLSNASDIRLFVILTAGLVALLDKYIGKKDILLGAPIYKQDVQGEFINTLLPLRNQVIEKMTFKDLVITVSQTIKEANENQNYPLEILLEQLNMSMSGDSVPLFDAAVLLQNIHDKAMITHVNFNMIIAFLRTEEALEGELEYNASLYRKTTIERIIKHLSGFLQRAVLYPSTQTADIDILTEREKRQLLIDFNDSNAEYPRDKTIHELFTRNVEITPDKIAVVFEGEHLSYRELHEQSNPLARVLRGKGVKTDTNVGIMVERSIEMIVGILAILKAGAAYLPVNVESPAKRVGYMLDDGNVPVLLTKSSIIKNDSFVQLQGEQKGATREIIIFDLLSLRLTGSGFNPDHNGHSSDLAYTIYTSGSTGKPKGVLVEHRNVVRLVKNTNFVDFSEGNRILPTGALDFDASTFEIWGALINGLSLQLTGKDNILTPEKLRITIRRYDITLVWFTAPLFNYLVEADIDIFSGLRNLVVGGDALSPAHIEKVRVKYPGLKIINGYGPTENTTFSTTFLIEEQYKENIPIGRPINNSKAYIVGKKEELQPLGAAGELYVGGDGVSRGYLNIPELTFEKFVINPFIKGERVYRTGDLARWLPDGNIEFLGRLDQQVKIRGYRIELGEIESKLSKHKEIKNNVVIASTDESGSKFLVAYIVPRSPGSVEYLAVPELRGYLLRDFPDYMIPSYFLLLDEIPLTLNGKVNRKALPPFSVKKDARQQLPRDKVEKQMAEIWSQVLGLDKEIINIDMSFFEWGGHSLNATKLISKLHHAFDAKIPLLELFLKPTIRELAEYVRRLTASRDRFLHIEPVEKKEYYPLSSTQKRIYVLQQMNLKNSGYNIPQLLILEGRVDKRQLETAFKKLIERHDSLRTSFEMVNEKPVQIIHDKVEFEIKYISVEPREQDEGYRAQRSSSDDVRCADLIHNFVRPFDLSQAPILRVGLIRQEEILSNRCFLVIDMHHTITDGTSMDLLEREFRLLYSGMELSPLRLQYKDYALWQNSEMQRKVIKLQEEYWLKQFEEEVPVLNLPTDYSRPAVQSFEGSSLMYRLSIEHSLGLSDLALNTGTTIYIVLLAFYNVLLSKLSGQEDIVVGTPTASRRHVDLEHIIGMFVNTLPMRNYPQSHKTFMNFLAELKNRTLLAFENQEYQIEDLVEKVVMNRDPSRTPLYDVVLLLSNMEAKEIPLVQMTGLKVIPYKDESQTAKFDLNLACMESEEGMILKFEYCTKLFRKETIERFFLFLREIIHTVIENPHTKLTDIEIITEAEKKQLLIEFNDIGPEYPKGKTIHRLFAEQVLKTPDNIALIGMEYGVLNMEGLQEIQRKIPEFGLLYLTYNELNEKSDRMAHLLWGKGVKEGDIVGILVDRSIEMIIGLLGILKTGSGYVSLNPKAPGARNEYIMNDCNIRILLTTRDLFGEGKRIGIKEPGKPGSRDREPVFLDEPLSFINGRASPGSRPHMQSFPTASLAYLMFTSGSTGKPKGVPLTHANFSPLVHWGYQSLGLSSTKPDRAVQNLPYYFDWSVWEIFITLTSGASLHMVPEKLLLDSERYIDFINRKHITLLHITPTHFQALIRVSPGRRLHTLRYLCLGAERLPYDLVERSVDFLHEDCRVFNHYGPTEATILAAVLEVDKSKFSLYKRLTSVPAGITVANTKLLILDRCLKPCPIYVPGELYIGGDALAMGYLNNPALTAERFVENPYPASMSNDPPLTGDIYYKTGDLCRWLPDGTMEFLERIDHQVKIRGHRIELGEIENHLLANEKIKEAVVLVKEKENGDKYLCAYVIPHEEKKAQLEAAQLRKILSQDLPDYMVPAYFVQLEDIPRTPNGKVDRRALPVPTDATFSTQNTPPRNSLEEKLVELLSEVLEIEKASIGIDDNFYELGIHSLEIASLTAKIHKSFYIKIHLVDIFRLPTVRELAQYIKEAEKQIYSAIKPGESKDYYVLSSAQKRLYILQQMELKSTAYNVPEAVPLPEDIDEIKLTRLLTKLIERHEVLRTSFHVVNDIPVQRVHDEVGSEIEYYKVEETDTPQPGGHPSQEAIINDFIRPFDLSRAPLLRVGLVKKGDEKNLLVVDMHHIISDGVSHEILVRDFMALYNGEKLSPLRLQYRDFARWQDTPMQKERINTQEKYWLKEFEGKVPLLNMPTDYTRSPEHCFEGSALSFKIDPGLTHRVKELASQSEVTLLMFLISIYKILLSKYTGQEDIVVGTVIAGRRHEDLKNIIGFFVNMLALKTTPQENKTFREFLREVKEKAVQAYENQDYPFEELVSHLQIQREPGRHPLIDTVFVLQDAGEARTTRQEAYVEKENRNPNPLKITHFDLMLHATVTMDSINMIFEYSTTLFKMKTIERISKFYLEILEQVVENKHITLGEIKSSRELVPVESKVLQDSNLEFDF